MTRWMILTTVVCMLLTTGSLPAQSTFVMPDGSPPPRTVRKDLGVNGKVWVAFEGFRPRYGVDQRSREVPGQVLTFMQPLFVVAEHGQAGQIGHRMLLAKSGDGKNVVENVGWVDADIVVMSNQALHDSKTGVHRKAMIVQTLETLKARDGKSGQSEDKVGVTLVPIPRNRLTQQQREKATSFELFNVFFVFAETDTHLLIGTAEYFEEFGSSASSIVKGWLEKSHASRWNTRLAIEWDRATTLLTADRRRTEPALGFSTAEEAVDFVRGNKVDDKAIVFREERDKTGVALGFKPSEMRMPILAQGKKNYLPTQNQLVHVGGIYGARVDVQAQEAVRQELSKAAARLNHLQILFVIDGTGSMGKYFPQVAKTIGEVNQSLATLATQRSGIAPPQVRVAVSYYADELYSKVPFTVRALRTLNGSVAQELVNELSGYDELGRLKNERPQNAHEVQGGRDAPESVFLGIEKALDAAQFDSFGQKLVVVIGDMGDRIVDPLAEQVARQRLLKRLVPPSGDPIQLLAVQVAANQEEANLEVFTRFERQMKALTQDYLAQLTARIKADPAQLGDMARFVGSGQRGQVVSTVLTARYAQLAQEARQLQEELLKIAAGQRSHTEIGPAERLRLQQYNIDLSVLAGGQVFREGYVWLNDRSQRVRAIRQVVLIEEERITKLVELLDKLVGPRTGYRPTSLQALVSRELDALAGEAEQGGWQNKADWLKKERKDVTLAEAFFDQMGIPANSDLFRLTADQIGKLPESRFNELVKRLRLRHYRLKDILGGVKNDWKWEPRTDQSGQSYEELVANGAPKKLERAYIIPADPRRIRWFWVDVEEELP